MAHFSEGSVRPGRGLARLGFWQWPILLGAAIALSLLFGALKINASMFLAPMVAGLAFAFASSDLKIDRKFTMGSQAVIGCIVARSLDAKVLSFMLANALPVLFVIISTAAASVIVAWGLFRFSSLDDDTAAWGSMPGAAGIMVAFAADYGGDTRLVAFMQYIRLIVVVASASFVSAWLTHVLPTAAIEPAAHALKEAHAGLWETVSTLSVGAAGIAIGRVSRIPAGPLVVTAILGAILHLNGILDMTMPHWLLGTSYGIIGLFVGLQFDRSVLLIAVRNLPAIVVAIMVLIGLSGLVGIAFSWMLGVDALTGYLATSPGAIDTMTILALGSHSSMSIVMAVQAIRFFAVILLAPLLVKLIHRTCRRRLPAQD